MMDTEKSREKTAAGPHAEPYEKWIQQALAGLQLPHMPRTPFQPEQPGDPISSGSPSIRILLVSDVDLPSASALAEYTLLQKNEVFDASRIDLCIACGPFCRDEDLMPYLKGKQRSRLRQLLEEGNNHHQVDGRPPWSSSVFFRSQEETAAMEGLVTAAISQLESIVCRVVFCPGSTDPMSTSTSPEDLRFTPNSRNVHRQWLPLAPGLGCAGLLFLDTPTGVLRVTPPPTRQKESIDYDSDEEDDEEHDNFEEDETERHRHGPRARAASMRLTNIHGNEEMGADNYCRTLERLIRIAPPPQQHYPFGTELSQSILVTHYFQPPTVRERRRDDGDSEENCLEEDVIYDCGGDREDQRREDDSTQGAAEISQETPSEDGLNEIPPNDSGPWPSEHADFVYSPLIQDQLALEIASGGGASQRPTEMQKGNVRIIIPGSLRERGEFCLVDMSLMEQAVKNMATNTAKKKKSTFAWRVKNVEFHTMERLP